MTTEKKHKGRSPVTAADIAREVGLSRTTVSMVLRGEAEMRNISPKTAQRVLETARRLNYVPNEWARNFRRQRSGMIGVVFINFRCDWAQLVIHGMSGVFGAKDYTPFVAIHDFDRERARRELLSCLRRRDEGVIIQPVPGLTDLYERIQEVGIPLIFLGDQPADMEEANVVAWDSVPDARLAVEHLIEVGRRRIAFLGYDYSMPINQGRFEEYLKILEERDLPRKDHWISIPPIEWPEERIINVSLDRFFDGQDPPDAIFALNDGLAVPLLDLLERRGIRVPEDVAVVGMGDTPLAGHTSIGLSTVVEPLEEMGREAAELMMNLIENPDQAPVRRLIPGGELKVRRSTRPGARAE